MRAQQLKTRAGLTLVEIILTLAAASIVLFATAIILIFGQRSLDHGWRQANLQREASYAILKMKQSIRNAARAELEEDGSVIKIYHSSGWIKYKFVPDQKDLLYQLEGEQEQTLLDGIVESVTFGTDPVTNNTVTVGLNLKNSDCQAQISSTILMRNYGSGA
jgi:hypothetical protein